jgi:hypothetical protein
MSETQSNARQTKMYRATVIRREINKTMEIKYPMPASPSEEDKQRVLASRKSEGNKIAKARYRSELEMTDQGAATFCRNVNLFLEGKDPYASNKKANAKRAQALTTAQALPDMAHIATTLGNLYHKPTIDVSQRWWVVDESNAERKQITNTSTNRDTARATAKVLGNKVYDSKELIAA